MPLVNLQYIEKSGWIDGIIAQEETIIVQVAHIISHVRMTKNLGAFAEIKRTFMGVCELCYSPIYMYKTTQCDKNGIYTHIYLTHWESMTISWKKICF